MSKSREKIITVRVDEDMYKALKKRADSSGLALSEYVFRLLESVQDDNRRMDLLLNNVHENILQVIDMITMMQGFNFEVFTTLLARTSKELDPEQKKKLKEERYKAVDGLNGYIEKTAGKISAGENIWAGATVPLNEKADEDNKEEDS